MFDITPDIPALGSMEADIFISLLSPSALSYKTAISTQGGIHWSLN